MAKKRLRVALIGCGDNMRRGHVPRLRADGAVDVVGVADPMPDAAEALLAAWGGDAPSFRDWRRLLRDVDADAVLISTPHHAHHAQVKAALAAGRHVLVEKPLAMSPRQAQALLGHADRAGRMLAVAYQRHHLAPYVYARELVARGALGEVRGLVGYVTQAWLVVGGWRLDVEAAGGGMFMDTGSHLVASALWVSGLRPRRVSAAVSNGSGPVDVDAVMHVAFEGGAAGTLSTFGEAGRHDERLAIVGSRRSLVLRMHEWRFKELLVDDEPVVPPRRVRNSTPDHDFLAMVRNGGRGYEPPVYAVHVAKLTAAAYRSAAAGAPSAVRL